MALRWLSAHPLRHTPPDTNLCTSRQDTAGMPAENRDTPAIKTEHFEQRCVVKGHHGQLLELHPYSAFIGSYLIWRLSILILRNLKLWCNLIC